MAIEVNVRADHGKTTTFKIFKRRADAEKFIRTWICANVAASCDYNRQITKVMEYGCSYIKTSCNGPTAFISWEVIA